MSFQVQQQIKQNAADIRNYVQELYDWEEQMDTKVPENQKPSNSTEPKLAPIRGKADIKIQEGQQEDQKDQENQQNQIDNTQLKRDKNSIKDYYKAWDKFDVNKELEDLDKNQESAQQNKQQVINPYQQRENQPMAPAKSKIVIKGGRSQVIDANSLKEKGNLYFKSLEYDKAIETYTQCIDMLQKIPNLNNDDRDILMIIYSNRGMANIKIQEYSQGEKDCSQALKINPKHTKSLVRRGTAKKKMKDLKGALEDFQQAILIEPDNQEAQQEINFIQVKLSQIKEEATKQLILPPRTPDEKINNEISMNVIDSKKDDIDVQDEDDSENHQQGKNNDGEEEEDEEEVPITQFGKLKQIDQKQPHKNNSLESPNKKKSLQDIQDVEHVQFKGSVVELNTQNVIKIPYDPESQPQQSILKNEDEEKEELQMDEAMLHKLKNIDGKLIKHSEKHYFDQENEFQEEEIEGKNLEQNQEQQEQPENDKQESQSSTGLQSQQPIKVETVPFSCPSLDIAKFKEDPNELKTPSIYFVGEQVLQDSLAVHHNYHKQRQPRRSILKSHDEQIQDLQESFHPEKLKNIEGKLIKHGPLEDTSVNNKVGRTGSILIKEPIQIPSQVYDYNKKVQPRRSILKIDSVFEDETNLKIFEKRMSLDFNMLRDIEGKVMSKKGKQLQSLQQLEKKKESEEDEENSSNSHSSDEEKQDKVGQISSKHQQQQQQSSNEKENQLKKEKNESESDEDSEDDKKVKIGQIEVLPENQQQQQTNVQQLSFLPKTKLSLPIKSALKKNSDYFDKRRHGSMQVKPTYLKDRIQSDKNVKSPMYDKKQALLNFMQVSEKPGEEDSPKIKDEKKIQFKNITVSLDKEESKIESQKSNKQTSTVKKPPTNPITQIKFMQQWVNIKSDANQCIEFLENNVLPEHLNQIFKEGFEINTLLEIFKVFNAKFNEKQDLIKQYIMLIPQVKRFEITIKSTLVKERKDIKETIDKIMQSKIIAEDQCNNLKKLYNV